MENNLTSLISTLLPVLVFSFLVGFGIETLKALYPMLLHRWFLFNKWKQLK